MRQTISYSLLITWVVIALSCKTQYVQKNYALNNISVSEEQNTLDSSIVRLYQPYKDILEKDMNRVISVSDVELKKDKPESPLTNLLGDLLLEEGVRVAQNNAFQLVPDVSFFNYGGIRASLPEGEITVGNIFELMPFENFMVFLELEGKDMLNFLDYIADHNGGSIGGVRMLISEGRAEQVTIGGKPYDENTTYWLVTNDYVAGGGDGLEVLKEHKQYVNSGEKIRDAIIAYFERVQKNNKHIMVKTDGRISYE